MAEEVEQEVEVYKPEEDNREKLVRIVAGIFVVIAIISLIIYRIRNPDFPLIWIIVIGIFVLTIGSIAFFVFSIYKKFQQAKEKVESIEKIPEPLDEKQLAEKLDTLLNNEEFEDHIAGFGFTKQFNYGKNVIYAIELLPLWDLHRKYTAIINANYPNRKPQVLIDANNYDIMNAARNCSTEPYEEPDVLKDEFVGPMGTQISTRKIHKLKKNTSSDKPQEGGIA